MKLFSRIITLCVLAVFAAGAYAGNDGVRVKKLAGSGSGWAYNAPGHDINGDGFSGVLGNWEGTSTVGPFAALSSDDIFPWDGVSFCDSGNGILLTYSSSSGSVRTNNGDMIYLQLSASPPSTFCFNLSDSSYTFEIYSDIVGGTGKYVGATGNVLGTGSGQQLNSVFGPFEAEVDGEIVIVTGND